MTYRYKITIEYDGTKYHGMQKQNLLPTIEFSLEKALSKYCGVNKIYYCGRTDKGVHAIGQVAHFDLAQERSLFSITRGINFHLYKDQISIISAEKVEQSFHSRFDVKQRYYLYKIINRSSNLTFMTNTHLHIIKTLNIELMKKATNYIIGKHDFSAFRSSSCSGKNPIKTIDSIQIIQNDQEIHLVFCAKSFLHRMVRNIMGCLIEIGLGKKPPEWILLVLNSKDRTLGANTAPAHGLYFYKAVY